MVYGKEYTPTLLKPSFLLYPTLVQLEVGHKNFSSCHSLRFSYPFRKKHHVVGSRKGA